eukprot:TRINITY_DN28686_c0_g1_i1.p1 TRINITY_DN28686_c0_g1~~TRINITY_DN28686_c0_g1_i1.p1  ORF type:complete len:407 (-),score=38.66 TRINITY_DN28686_c0_g1_i1:499-1719(-)
MTEQMGPKVSANRVPDVDSLFDMLRALLHAAEPLQHNSDTEVDWNVPLTSDASTHSTTTHSQGMTEDTEISFACEWRRFLLETLIEAHDEFKRDSKANSSGGVDASRRVLDERRLSAVVRVWLKRCGYAPSVSCSVQRGHSNPLLDLHTFVHSRVPCTLRKLWGDPSELSKKDVSILRALSSEKPLVRHAEIGRLCANPAMYYSLVLNPLTKMFSFAVPSEEALACAARYEPLIEIGAGTGYWSQLLRARGCDIVAYDIAPPSETSPNPFFTACFGEVCRGGPEVLSNKSNERRALLLAWPHSDIERAAHSSPNTELTTPWDAACLDAFQGDVVLYIGEWERQSAPLSGPGLTSSSEFQTRLRRDFKCIERVALPNWLHVRDDMSVWQRRRSKGKRKRQSSIGFAA